jgi:hypothetical protein
MALSISGSSPSFSSYQGGTITSGTAQASTSGTSITFSSIPSWIKRVTIMFNGVSTNGTSDILVQIGSGSVTTTGYASSAGNRGGDSNSTAGFIISRALGSTDTLSGNQLICLISSNTYTSSHTVKTPSSPYFGGGNSPALSGALDRVVITTVNGTDTFDAGTINILYE